MNSKVDIWYLTIGKQVSQRKDSINCCYYYTCKSRPDMGKKPNHATMTTVTISHY